LRNAVVTYVVSNPYTSTSSNRHVVYYEFFFISDEKFRTVQVDWIVVSRFSLSLARSIWSPTVGIKQLISLTVIHVSEAIT